MVLKKQHIEIIISILKDEIKSNEDYILDLKNKQEVKAWKTDNRVYKKIIEVLKNGE